jgi:hypothetical protein
MEQKRRQESQIRQQMSLWKRIKGAGSRDTQLSVNHVIKEFTIWCRKIAMKQREGNAFVYRVTQPSLMYVCMGMCEDLALMRLKLGSTPTTGLKDLEKALITGLCYTAF